MWTTPDCLRQSIALAFRGGRRRGGDDDDDAIVGASEKSGTRTTTMTATEHDDDSSSNDDDDDEEVENVMTHGRNRRTTMNFQQIVDWSLCAYRHLSEQIERQKHTSVSMNSIDLTMMMRSKATSTTAYGNEADEVSRGWMNNDGDDHDVDHDVDQPKQTQQQQRNLLGTVRVTAMSQFVGTLFKLSPQEPQTMKQVYRFVYRIRMENLSPNHDVLQQQELQAKDEDDNESSNTTLETDSSRSSSSNNSFSDLDPIVLQLLGRTWTIQELDDDKDLILPFEDEAENNDDDSEAPLARSTTSSRVQIRRQRRQRPAPMQIDAPTTGAVGQHPVLHPMEGFEYMSMCDLSTRHGEMHGAFTFATVPPHTRSVALGKPVVGLNYYNNNMNKNNNSTTTDNKNSDNGDKKMGMIDPPSTTTTTTTTHTTSSSASSSFYYEQFQAKVAPFPLSGRNDKDI